MSKKPLKYGGFGESPYLSQGDPYRDPPNPHGEGRFGGLNMKATRRKTGKTNDAAFDRLKPLYEGEKYAGTQTPEERRAARELREEKLVQKAPLKPPSRVKTKTSGLGSYDGALGPKFVTGPNDPWAQPPDDLPDPSDDGVTDERPPFCSSAKPGRKGSYGYKGLTLGGPKGNGVCGEYAYWHYEKEDGKLVVDDYDAERKLERRRREEHVKAMKKVNPNLDPFRPTSLPQKGKAGASKGTTLGGRKGTGVCGEYGYATEGPEPKEERVQFENVWKLSRPNKGPINKPAKFMADPAELREAERREERERELELKPENPFKPTGRAKQGAVKSVVRMDVKAGRR